MIQSPSHCIACGTEPFLEKRNGLSMKVCPTCHLFWRADFDLDIVYYEEKEIILDSKKLEARIRNVHDRANLIETHASMENLCDVGCGEGLFLSEAVARGATHVLGMEPGAEAAAYARSLGHTIVTDPIDQLKRIADEHAPLSMFTLFHVIEHLPDPTSAIRLIRSLLPKSGIIVLETPDFTSVSFTGRAFQHKHIYPEHLFYWNPRSLSMILEKEGFTVLANRHRDFDRFRLEPREALRRLGISKYPPPSDTPVVRGENVIEAVQQPGHPLKMVIKRFLSLVLSLAVIATGKGEYLWIVATPGRAE